MKNKLLLYLVMFFLTVNLKAEKITPETARTVAVNFFNYLSNTATLNEVIPINSKGIAMAYIVLFNPEGYVIVSADAAFPPIVCYSEKGIYEDLQDSSDNSLLLEEMIQTMENKEVNESSEIHPQWKNYLDKSNTKSTAKSTVLSSTTAQISDCWYQFEPYNYLTPTICLTPGCSDNERVKAAVGCTALAMARIIRHWEFPAYGRGSHSYTSATQGIYMSANFGNTLYDYQYMYDNDDPYHEAAKLILHCGIAVNMDYGEDYKISSGATMKETELFEHFKYFSTIVITNPDSTQERSIPFMCKTLDAGIPILMSSFTHSFIFDSYQVVNGITYFRTKLGDSNCGLDNYYSFENLSYNNYSAYLYIRPPQMFNGTLSTTFENACHTPLYGNIQTSSLIKSGAILSMGGSSIKLTKGFKVEKGAFLRIQNLPDSYITASDFTAKGAKEPFADNELDNNSSISVQPNPSNGIFNIAKNTSDENTWFTLFDFSGKQILSDKLATDLYELDLSNLTNGVYFLIVNSNMETSTHKLVKQ